MADVDLSEFVKLSQRSQRKPCKVALALEQLKPAECRQLVAALARDDGTITNAGIINWCGKRGVAVSNPAVTNHRQKRCACVES